MPDAISFCIEENLATPLSHTHSPSSVPLSHTLPPSQDFPDEVLDAIAQTPNICNNIHLPAQSGSSRLLEAMRRSFFSLFLLFPC
jgi:tRNA A37 methylthiotransferase MiaB